MKSIILKLSNAILIVFLLFSSCNLIDNEDLTPGITIYKTRGDYYNLVDIGMKGDKIYRTNSFWNSRYDSYHFIEFIDNDTLYTQRYRLVNGYILDSEADERYDVFINMTHKEHLKREVINSEMELGVSVSGDTLRKYIIDKDPYTEFYRNKTDVKRLYLSDSLEINEIILNGEIDKYFEKIKQKQ
jgi:hypothetical protein